VRRGGLIRHFSERSDTRTLTNRFEPSSTFLPALGDETLRTRQNAFRFEQEIKRLGVVLFFKKESLLASCETTPIRVIIVLCGSTG
jgi:hypothetical protein